MERLDDLIVVEHTTLLLLGAMRWLCRDPHRLSRRVRASTFGSQAHVQRRVAIERTLPRMVPVIMIRGTIFWKVDLTSAKSIIVLFLLSDTVSTMERLLVPEMLLLQVWYLVELRWITIELWIVLAISARVNATLLAATDFHRTRNSRTITVSLSSALDCVLLLLFLAAGVDVLHLAVHQIQDLDVHNLDYVIEALNDLLLPISFLSFDNLFIGLDSLDQLLCFTLM